MFFIQGVSFGKEWGTSVSVSFFQSSPLTGSLKTVPPMELPQFQCGGCGFHLWLGS